MEPHKVVFNQSQQPEFFQLVTKRVNDYFQENGKSRYANLGMKLKSVIILLLYFIPLCYLIFGDVTDLTRKEQIREFGHEIKICDHLIALLHSSLLFDFRRCH